MEVSGVLLKAFPGITVTPSGMVMDWMPLPAKAPAPMVVMPAPMVTARKSFSFLKAFAAMPVTGILSMDAGM